MKNEDDGCGDDEQMMEEYASGCAPTSSGGGMDRIPSPSPPFYFIRLCFCLTTTIIRIMNSGEKANKIREKCCQLMRMKCMTAPILFLKLHIFPLISTNERGREGRGLGGLWHACTHDGWEGMDEIEQNGRNVHAQFALMSRPHLMMTMDNGTGREGQLDWIGRKHGGKGHFGDGGLCPNLNYF